MIHELKKVLLVVDGSDQSLEAVFYASKVLPSRRAKVSLFHVLNDVPEFFYDLG